MTQPELTDQQMAIRLIEGMNSRVTIDTIIRRLSCIGSAIQMSGMLIKSELLTEDQATGFLKGLILQYEEHRKPPAAE